MRGANPVVDYDDKLTAGLRSAINFNSPGKAGIIRVSSLGGCLLHDAYYASVAGEMPDEDEADRAEGLPAYLGKAFEEAVIGDICAERWDGISLLTPPDGREQWSVDGSAYGLPNLKGHLDAVLEYREREVLGEIKLMNPYRYRRLVRGEMAKSKKATLPGLENFPPYKMQIHTYAGLLGLPETIFVVGCSYAGMIQDDIPDSLVVLRVPYDESEFYRAIERAEELQHHLNFGTKPKCERAEYCRYRKDLI